MTAPLPLRFYNPVKDLCTKMNLDYETVIGTGISNSVIRDAFICADIPKPIDEIKSEDRKLIKHKKDFFDKKYGHSNTTSGTGNSENTDKGSLRYNEGVTVEYILSNDSKVDESAPVSNCVGNSNFAEFGREHAKYRPKDKWIPGRS